MNSKLAALASITILPFLASAAEESPRAPAYQLKKRSSFSATEDVRAPFWPIGWTKRSEKGATGVAAAPAKPKFMIDASQFKITSILLGSPSLAVINGRAYGEGEFLKNPRPAAGAPATGTPAVAAPLPGRVRVQQITDSAVVLQCGEDSISVPFQRPGLAAKPAGWDLLFEDR